MKLKPIQIFLVLYLILVFIRFVLKEFYFSYYTNLKYIFNGLLLGLVVVCLVYYARIYITAWIRVKKEDKQKDTTA